METKHLLFFKRTAELENMTKAAESLMVSQPFLSRSIAELESELGVKLFNHVGRGIVLNPCGHVFYKRVVNIFNEAEDAIKEVRDMNKVLKSQIRVVTNVSLYIPGLFRMITDNNVDLKLYTQSAKISDISKMLKNGQANFAICCPPLEDAPDLETATLCFEPGVIIYPEGHWLKDYEEIAIGEIKNEAFISVPRGYGTRDALEMCFKKYDIEPTIAIETNDTSSVFKYVGQGLGIAAIPLSIVLTESEFKTRFVRVREKVGAEISLSWRKKMYVNDVSRMFVETILDYFEMLEKLRQKV